MRIAFTAPLSLFLLHVFSINAFFVTHNRITTCRRFPALAPNPVRLSSAKEEVSSNTKELVINQDKEPQAEEKAAVIDKPDAVETGSHQELMYALGVNLARQLGDVRPLVQDGEELAQLAKGLLDTVLGRLSETGQTNLLQSRGADLDKLVTERAQELQDRMKLLGLEVLEDMAATEGAVTLDTGVVLHVLEAVDDSATRPTKASTVKIHYHGTLVDGTSFDSTLGGEPVKFPLAGVIPGWRDAVLKMKEGETAMVGIPPDQAYGDKGTPDGRIPGGSTILFKIQLLEVLSAGIGGGPTLLGADGNKLDKNKASGGLLGADGKPMA